MPEVIKSPEPSTLHCNLVTEKKLGETTGPGLYATTTQDHESGWEVML